MQPRLVSHFCWIRHDCVCMSILLYYFFPGLTPDKEVRVSVKALAVSCIGAAAALHPEAFFNSLYLEPLDGIPVAGRDIKNE